MILSKFNIHYFILIFCIFLIEIIVSPFGNFPLNDDWCYAIPVRDLVKGLPLKLVNWGSMTLVTQLIWGFIFSKFFGFSFFVLRLSVLSLHVVACMVLYKLITRNSNATLGLFLTLFYVFNPLVLSLSNSFMTDVTCLSIAIFTIYYYQLVFINNNNFLAIFLSVIFTILLILTRQIGLYLPISLVVIAVLSKNKRLILLSGLIFLVAILTLQLYEYWLVVSENKINNYFKPADLILTGFQKIPQICFSFYHRLSLYLFYSGLFLMPFSGIYLYDELKNITKKDFLKVILYCSPLLICSLRAFPSFPCHNVKSNVSVGAQILYDNFIPNPQTDYNQYPKVALFFKILALVGAWMFIFLMYFKIKNLKNIIQSKFFLPQMGLFSYITYSFMMAFSDGFMDRYIMPVFLATIFIFVYFGNKKLNYYYILSFLIVMGLFSLLTTRDYFEWNNTRSHIYNQLLETENTSHLRIHAGVDMWGWQNYKHQDAIEYRNTFGAGNWDFILTFQPKVENLKIYKKYPYQRFIPYKIDTLYVQTRF